MLSARPGAVVAQGPSELRLIEASSWSLDEGVRVSRLSVDARRRIVIQDGPRVLLVGPSGARLIGNFDLLHVVGLAIRDRALVLLDARTRRIVETDMRGRVIEWLPIGDDLAGALVAGALTRCGWVLGFDEGRRGGSVALLGPDGRARARHGIAFRPSSVTATGRWSVASEATAPYRFVVVDCENPSRFRAYRRPVDGAHEGSGSWRALPAFVAGAHVLQTLTDLESDRRRFAVFDRAAGRFLRETRIDAPLTLVAAGCDGEVVGLRHARGLALVIFRELGAESGGWACRDR